MGRGSQYNVYFGKITWIILVVLLAACEPLQVKSTQPDDIRGIVLDEHGPVSGAIVRIQTTQRYTLSDSQGRFVLFTQGLDIETIKVTAWAPGYYIVSSEELQDGVQNVQLLLQPHSDEDNPSYEWLPSHYHPGQGEIQGCAECHSSENSELGFSLPVDEWLQDAHSQSAVNPRFVTMYRGQDVNGNQSPSTHYAYSRDYGRFPLRPDPSQPYYGPGYKLDFPDTAGNCAACHTPAAAANAPYGTDPTQLTAALAEGIPCDFCHKIWSVKLDANTGLPNANMPGVLSFEFRRPPQGHQFFAGPLDDVAPGEDTYSPLQTRSQICAPCHFGVFWDTVIYDSFGEWLRSEYSDPQTGQTCQDCHMPRLGVTHFVKPEKGGLTRYPETIFSHRMPGALDADFIRQAIDFKVKSAWKGTSLEVQVSLTNINAGHDIPTDSPLRHLILVVRAWDGSGIPLELIEGETLPDWVGVGDAEKGYYAGLPGKAFAKVLEEIWTSISPTGAYWNPTRLLYDNRLSAFEVDVSKFVFSTSGLEEAEVEALLIYRRAFIELIEQKGWDIADILLFRQVDKLHP